MKNDNETRLYVIWPYDYVWNIDLKSLSWRLVLGTWLFYVLGSEQNSKAVAPRAQWSMNWCFNAFSLGQANANIFWRMRHQMFLSLQEPNGCVGAWQHSRATFVVVQNPTPAAHVDIFYDIMGSDTSDAILPSCDCCDFRHSPFLSP